jgi:hypothetical protein
MNKDVIYIDVEDDITAIISKVKASKQKIVALVPPKRIGVLQSAVNLRLLERTASQSDKRLVLITNNHALSSLAASAKLPVAKNLQSKPELAPIAALEVDDENDIIDGNDLPVGEHAKLASADESPVDVPSSVIAGLAEPPKEGETPKPVRKRASPKSKVPNFNTFRKRMIIAIIGGLLLIAFLVWAIFFAPRATVVVSAKTNDSSVNVDVTASDKTTTSISENTIKAIRVSKSEDKEVEFNATGSKNVGEKATGSVDYENSSANSVTIAAGTTLTSEGGLNFVTSESVTVPAATLSFSCSNFLCPGSESGAVAATEPGAKYNAATGGLSGTPSSVSANFGGPTSGGTDKIAKVVTANDVQKAKESLVSGEDDKMENELKSSLKEAKYIEGSYAVDYADVVTAPDVGEEVPGGTATLAAEVTYSVYGISNNELGDFLDKYLKNELGNDTEQYVYDNGKDDVEFQDVTNSDTGATLTIVATAKVGPKLSEDRIRSQSLGKKGGDIQEALQDIQGVEDVDVSYFPFWVNSVPNDEKKVTVRFDVNDK